ncbi:permease prefix domain 1-containing protein [Catenuloplanes japonicus]|uniref:permease prefix domain 1-containing protein n=1 Tax=Catenuloplanes japonicus TaxID=33876 RepID=UPI0005246A2D|nr:permease prefix domain 1-containing protein [Catenuloplanes japonicus]
MTTLIDRYVTTALRRIPEGQRADIDRELRASIEDAVEARVDAGATHDAAVESTLLELGDPDRLADRYSDRPQHLIGPELYPAWRRMMTMLFTVVLPIVVIVTTVIQLIDDPAIGKVIGGMVTTIISVGTHMGFWTTGTFALLERVGLDQRALRGPWTPADLPEYEPTRLGRSQLVPNVAWPVLLIAGLVLQQFTFTDVPVLDPANWSFWWPYLIVVLGFEIAWAIWVYRTGVYTRAIAAANAVLALLVAAPVVWLAVGGHVFNPAFPGLAPGGEPLYWASLAVMATFAITALWDIVEIAVRAERSRRGLPVQVPGTGGL